MSGNCGLSISQTLTAGLRRAVYRYFVLGEPLTTHNDNILRATATSQKNYFKLNKENSKDGLEHWFYFTVKFSKTEVIVRKFEYKHPVSLEFRINLHGKRETVTLVRTVVFFNLIFKNLS